MCYWRLYIFTMTVDAQQMNFNHHHHHILPLFFLQLFIYNSLRFILFSFCSSSSCQDYKCYTVWVDKSSTWMNKANTQTKMYLYWMNERRARASLLLKNKWVKEHWIRMEWDETTTHFYVDFAYFLLLIIQVLFLP